MNKAIVSYLSALASRSISQSWREHSETTLLMLLVWLNEKQGINEWRAVSKTHMRAFLIYLQCEYLTARDKRLKSATIRTMWSCVSGFFTWHCWSGYLLHNPTNTIELPAMNLHLPNVLSESEIFRLIEAPNTETEKGLRDRALMELLYATGIRRNEAMGLNVFDADMRTRLLMVREGKGGDDRVVPMTQNCCYWLNRYLAEARHVLATGKLWRKAGFNRPVTPAIWLSTKGLRLSYESIDKIVRQYAGIAGLKANAHTFRHSFATHLLRGGADIRQLQQLLGHRSIDTTMIYTHMSIEDLKSIVAKLEDIE